jgi:WD40 repeat protein
VNKHRRCCPTGPSPANQALSRHPAAQVTPTATSGTRPPHQETRKHEWDITDRENPELLGQPAGTGNADIAAAAFSPDGQTLVTGSEDGTVAASAPGQGIIDTDTLSSAQYAFSPDGKMLASADTDGGVSLWDITAPSRPRQAGQINIPGEPPVDQVTFSLDGRTIAVETGNGSGISIDSGPQTGTSIALWDIANPARPRQLGRPLSNAGLSAVAAAFSPDGRTLAIGNGNNTVTRWNITNPARPRQAGQAPRTTGTVTDSAAYSPQGILATANSDGTIQLWDFSASYAISQICSTTTLTPQQWHQYLLQLPYRPPCPQ